ncbi:unnamed protein product [Mytilus coruscus]|uniref:TIR domain-containing protein n=1 Tax=Mytilus coruscus TaxID=42192 RepID=A0A6J8DZE8_MYTCO|nr:unnamed protein product [Mytilus coruscus]
MSNKGMLCYITLLVIAIKAAEAFKGPFPCQFESRCSCSYIHERLTADCAWKGLRYIPTIPTNVANISFAHNNICGIKNGIFRINHDLIYLDLSNNNISKLHQRSFQGLSKLETLIISNNSINHTAIPINIFKPLVSLLHLALKRNFNHPFSLNVSSLVTLRTLKIDVVPHGNEPFGEEYAKLRFLQELDLSGLNGYCTLKVLTQDTFKYMPHIERLDLSKCKINTILTGSFKILVHLKYLDLSDNRCLKFKGLANVTYDLPSTSIEILRVNKIHQTFDLNTILTKCQIEPLNNTNITEIQMASNRLQLIEKDALKFLPKTLKKITIADNEFSYGNYIMDVFYVTAEEVNASYMGLSHYLLNSDEPCDINQAGFSPCNKTTDTYREMKIKRNDQNHHRNKPLSFSLDISNVPIPRNIKKFHFRECKLRYYLVKMNFLQNKLEYIDISNNAFYVWQGPISNLTCLTYLDISNNFCSNVSTNFFEYGSNLTTLLIQNNLLGFVLPIDTNGEILAKLTKLKLLNLADNRIPSLPTTIFYSQTEIRMLNLSGNMLENVKFKIDHMTKLSYLDLSYNRLSTLGASFTRQLDILSNNVPNIAVNLLGNPIKCSCESIEFIKWYTSTNVHVLNNLHQECQSLQINLNSSKLIYDYLKKTCSSHTTTIVTVGSWLTIFAIVIIAGIAYRYRWKLRYAYYIVKGKHHGQIKPFETDDDFLYDAFVSYADEDDTFVYTKFLKYLEDDRNIRCCVHKRDFLAGNDIATNITSAIHNSRKTVVIMSHHFLESDWCLFEFNMAKMESIYARSKENIILLVFLEQISSKDLPLNILELIQSKSYIEYPNDEYGDVVFWDKLKETLSV